MKISQQLMDYRSEVVDHLHDWGMVHIMQKFSLPSITNLVEGFTRTGFLMDESTRRCVLQLASVIFEGERMLNAMDKDSSNHVESREDSMIENLIQILNKANSIKNNKVH